MKFYLSYKRNTQQCDFYLLIFVDERSVNMEQTAPSSIPPPGTTPFMMIPDHQSPTQQMWMNPSDQIFTTIMRMMDQQRLMFNPFIGMDPRFLPSQMVRQDPSDNWLAKILIFPDGRVERTIKDLQPMVIFALHKCFKSKQLVTNLLTTDYRISVLALTQLCVDQHLILLQSDQCKLSWHRLINTKAVLELVDRSYVSPFKIKR